MSNPLDRVRYQIQHEKNPDHTESAYNAAAREAERRRQEEERRRREAERRRRGGK